MKLELPPGLLRLLAALREAGGRPYVVGGAVRDALLGLPLKDFDVEVFGLPAERLEPVLAAHGRVDAVGQAFRVYKLSGVEGVRGALDVAAPAARLEGRPRAPGHRGEGDPGLSRRGGRAPPRLHDQRDACSTRPRASSSTPGAAGATSRRACCAPWTRARSADDPLRALRGVQFAARYELQVDEATAAPVRRDAARRAARRAGLRRDREAAAQGAPAVARARARSGVGDAAGDRARAPAARGDAPGPGLAPRGRRVDAHAAGRGRGGARCSRDWATTGRGSSP